MIAFTVAPDLFALFPGLSVVGAVAHGLDNRTENSAATARWHDAWRTVAGLGTVYPNAQSHPHVAPWREAMRAAGAAPKQFPSSIEAILRRAMKGGDPFTISPLVDGYNAVSLDLVIPAGGFDLDDLPGDLDLRRTVAGDTFLALGDREAIPVTPGEYGYASGSTVLTRHIAWRQSERGAITPATRSVVLLSEILPDVATSTPGIGTRVAGALATLLRDDFGADATPFQIDEGQPTVTLRD